MSGDWHAPCTPGSAVRRATGASNVNAIQKTISKTRENTFLYPENAIQKTISKRHSKGNQKIDTRGVKRMGLGISIRERDAWLAHVFKREVD